MNTLLFDIPYIFTVKGIPKRGTKERQAFFYEKVELSVTAVDRDEAPIAAVFQEPFGHTTYVGDNDLNVTLRYWEGRLYAKALTSSTGDERLDATPKMLADFLEGGVRAVERADRLDRILTDRTTTLQRGLFPSPSDLTNNPIKPFVEEHWSSWTSPDRDADREKAETLFSDLLVIDGQFWKVVPEPRYLLTHSVERDEDRVSVSINDPSETRRFRRGEEFGLANWENLVRYSEATHGITPSERYMVDVLIEEAFPYDEAFVRFRHLVSSAVDHDGDMLKRFRPSSMMDWAAFRDALALATACDFAPETVAALATAAETYAACPDASKQAISMIAEAVEMMDNRPVDIMSVSRGVNLPR